MKKYFKVSLLALMTLGTLGGCGDNTSTSINSSSPKASNSNSSVSLEESISSSSEVNSSSSSSSEVNVTTSNNTSSSTIENVSSSSKVDYGELVIPDMMIYTNFPDAPQPTFTNPEYASEITYTILDENSDITFKDGYFSANDMDSVTVEAKTQYHETSFEVSAMPYQDAKGANQTTWYLNRVKSVEKNWINDGKPTGGTLFIGDSFFDTEFWSDFYKTFGENVYTHGVSSSTSTDWEIFAKRLVYPVQPKNIVMHLGTNNLYDDNETSVATFDNLKRLLEEIHTRLPETQVYYFAIEPRTYGIGGGGFNQATYNKINDVNLSMMSYSNKNEYMTFVDATSYCYTSGITVNSSFFRDGTHPTLANYMIYVNLLKEAGLEVEVNENYFNTTSFDIANQAGISGTNNLIKCNGKVVNKEYSISGKLKVTSTGGNAHIQFSLDDTSFKNRFLLWDNDSNGSLIPGYAINENHVAGVGDAKVLKDEEHTWEVVSTTKHSYFYVDGALEIVFLNMNSQNFMIGAENTGVSFYDISVITKEDNLEDYNTVLAREEINKYETSSETTKKAIVE